MLQRTPLTCADCGKTLKQSRSSLPQGRARCNPCRKANPEHGKRSTYQSGCRCQACKEANNDACREYAARRKERTGVSMWAGRSAERRSKHDLTCEQCGSPFRAESPAQRFCSRSCFGDSNRKPRCVEIVHVGPAEPRHAPVVAPTVIVTLPKWWAVITQGPCSWCGTSFTSTGHKARYCSKRCQSAAGNANHRRRHGRFAISPTARLAIYERDDWTCQLCFEPVARDVHYLDDWAPSLDHIEPQSHALIPDHSDANLRTAHRWCNSVRGDGTYHAEFFEEAS